MQCGLRPFRSGRLASRGRSRADASLQQQQTVEFAPWFTLWTAGGGGLPGDGRGEVERSPNRWSIGRLTTTPDCQAGCIRPRGQLFQTRGISTGVAGHAEVLAPRMFLGSFPSEQPLELCNRRSIDHANHSLSRALQLRPTLSKRRREVVTSRGALGNRPPKTAGG